jgi:small subunit ribosomal protein S3
MGQKVNPIGIRLGIVKTSDSCWYADTKRFPDVLQEDLKVRALLKKRLTQGTVSRVKIERPARNAKITIYTSRPGMIIGKNGKEIEELRQEIGRMLGIPVHISIEEIRKPDIDAVLVADNVAQQLARRVAFRRAMKRAVSNALRGGALGIRIAVSGRLGGAEIARTEWYREGRVPLHTLRADIDYGTSESLTTYGIIGVKVWIFRGEIMGDAFQHQKASQLKEKTAKKSSRRD